MHTKIRRLAWTKSRQQRKIDVQYADLAWIDANIWRQINNWMFSLYMITAHNILTSLGSNVVSTMVQQELKAWQNQSLFFGELNVAQNSKTKSRGNLMSPKKSDWFCQAFNSYWTIVETTFESDKVKILCAVIMYKENIQLFIWRQMLASIHARSLCMLYIDLT